jgi:transposase-like protein
MESTRPTTLPSTHDLSTLIRLAKQLEAGSRQVSQASLYFRSDPNPGSFTALARQVAVVAQLLSQLQQLTSGQGPLQRSLSRRTTEPPTP